MPYKTQRYDRDRRLRTKYGMTIDEYDILYEAQGGFCKLCGGVEPMAGRRLAVDHHHPTGTVRGLLCSSCNRGIGLLKDNPVLLEAAAKYIREANINDDTE